MQENEKLVDWVAIASIRAGGMICVPSLLIGSTLLNSLTFIQAVIAGLVGFTFVVIFMSLGCVAALKNRQTAVELASSSFGNSGSIIVGLLAGVSTIGWFAIQTNIAGVSFSHILRNAAGIELSESLSSAFWGIIMMTTSVFGFKYLKWLNYIALPAITIMMVYGLILSFQDHSFQEILDYVPKNKIPLLEGIGLTIGFVSVAGVIAPDYTRFAKTKKDIVVGEVVGLIPPAMLFLMIGAILSITQKSYDIVEIFSSMGFPFFAMSVLILATWTTNVINIYSAGLAFNKIFNLAPKFRARTTIIVGLLGVCIATVGTLDYFKSFIVMLSIMLPPVSGVIISDYFITKSFTRSPKKVNVIGVISWLSGVVLVLVMEHATRYMLGIVLSACIYAVLLKMNAKYFPKKI